MTAPPSTLSLPPPVGEASAGSEGPSSASVSIGLTERLASASARHPVRVLVLWGLAAVLALVVAGTSLKGLTTSASVVGATESSHATTLYDQVVGAAAVRTPTDVIVVSSARHQVREPQFASSVARLVDRVKGEPGITGVVTDVRPGSPFVSANGRAVLIELRAATDPDIKPVVRDVEAISGPGGLSAAVTGEHTVGSDFTTQASSDLRHGELNFGLPISLVILVLVFGSVVAGLLPVLLALVSIVVGLGIAGLLAHEFGVSIFIVNMMTGMGLALGIDYALFITSRFREERGHGWTKEAAIRRAGATASRAVLLSGTTFAVALLGMFLVPTNILRSLAAGAVIICVVTVVSALTLLPAVLTLLGDRVNALPLPVIGRNLGRAQGSESRIWRAMVERVVRRPVLWLVVVGSFLILVASPVVGLHVGQSGVATLPDSLPSKQGYLQVQRYFPDQNPNPVEIVAVGGTVKSRVDLSRLETVLADTRPFGPGAIHSAGDGRTLALTVPISGDAVSPRDVAAVRDLRQHVIPATFAGSRAQVYVGGRTAAAADYFKAVTGPTPYVLLFVLGLSFLLLSVAFRSLVIAAVSIALNLLAVGAAYGLLTLVFLHGVGAGIFGFHQAGAIDAWVPLFLFSVLFGLSMDYQVFLMSRIRERYDQPGSTHDAVVGGVASTARIITGAALIIVVVFTGFARGQLVQFQQMGFGVAVALLLDATLIRMVIMPSLLTLLDRRSWYLPGWLEWLPDLRVGGTVGTA
jgi:uncharacterized membrane protein YdfJ with MMPL/SSD domain